MNFFEHFSRALQGEIDPQYFLGAGSASAEAALGHYRYQHQAKIKEVLEDHFVITREVFAKEWGSLWKSFWDSRPLSPRSLDFYPAVFLQYAQQSHLPLALIELLEFEDLLQSFSLKQRSTTQQAWKEVTGTSRLYLHSCVIKTFSTPVTKLYAKSDESSVGPQIVIVWIKKDVTHFKCLTDWERVVLQQLQEGIDKALEMAPDDEQMVQSFFQWLGESGLVKAIEND